MTDAFFQEHTNADQFYSNILSLQICNQDPVNIIIGAWWMITLLSSLCLVRKIPHAEQKPHSGEKLLEEDHASPVGYKVPLLPDFEIDPALANTGSKFLSIQVEFVIGSILAIAAGAAMITLGFTSWDEDFYDELADTVSSAADNIAN